MPKGAISQFEQEFRGFVKAFGGEVLPEDAAHQKQSADYFFPKHNIVAELKRLIVDLSDQSAKKLGEIIDQQLAVAGRLAEKRGPDDILLHGFTADGRPFTLVYDQIFQRRWEKVLLTSIEGIIRDANGQIRDTKERLGIPSAHGVVLVFNESNPFHAAAPIHYARLAGEVIQKPDGAKRRFPDIQGMVYFSSRVTTFDERTGKDMPFWAPAQVRGHAVADVRRFQEDLKLAWYQHVEQMCGAPVVSHHRETGWPE